VTPSSLLRPLLRWISLVAAGLVLAALGASRLHQGRFVLFLGIVMALAVVVVAMYVATANGDERPETR
jgi:sulfite exporter TauE/SafE